MTPRPVQQVVAAENYARSAPYLFHEKNPIPQHPETRHHASASAMD